MGTRYVYNLPSYGNRGCIGTGVVLEQVCIFDSKF